MLETSIGHVVAMVNVENEFLWAAAFDDVGNTKRETQVESLTDIRAGWTAALVEVGLSAEEAEPHVTALIIAAEAAFEQWLESQPDRRRKELSKSWKRWKGNQRG